MAAEMVLEGEVGELAREEDSLNLAAMALEILAGANRRVSMGHLELTNKIKYKIKMR